METKPQKKTVYLSSNISINTSYFLSDAECSDKKYTELYCDFTDSENPASTRIKELITKEEAKDENHVRRRVDVIVQQWYKDQEK